MLYRSHGLLALLFALSACAGLQPTGISYNGNNRALEARNAQLLADVRTLSADSMEGRRTGTVGSQRAQAYLLGAFERQGLLRFGDSYEHSFTFVHGPESVEITGTNLVGYLQGTETPERFIVVTAHYDHLGIREGQIFNGADDNASGTAALFALAHHFRQHPPRNSIIFAALDAEELGLQGARAFVASPPVSREAMAININMDMISRNERDELYAAGTHHYPFLRPHVERVAERALLTLRMGHDRPDLPQGDDWTMSSDHGAFHEAGIPFIYFGVEDHEDYHSPTDVFENIDPDFYVRAVDTIIDFAAEIDRQLDSILARHEPAEAGAVLFEGR